MSSTEYFTISQLVNALDDLLTVDYVHEQYGFYNEDRKEDLIRAIVDHVREG